MLLSLVFKSQNLQINKNILKDLATGLSGPSVLPQDRYGLGCAGMQWAHGMAQAAQG